MKCPKLECADTFLSKEHFTEEQLYVVSRAQFARESFPRHQGGWQLPAPTKPWSRPERL